MNKNNNEKEDILKNNNSEDVYQRPPLKEEIEKFINEARTVSKFVMLGIGVFLLILIRDYISPIVQKLVRFVSDCANAIFVACMNALQALAEWGNKHPEKVVGFIVSVCLLVLCYHLIMTYLKHRHYIYQRFRIGHFSEMMWFGIGASVVQLAIIGSSMYLGIWLPILLVEAVLISLVFRNFIVFKQLRPTLPRPLTKRENEKRLELIEDLYNFYKLGLSDWNSFSKIMVYLALIADFHPDKLADIVCDEHTSKYSFFRSIKDVYKLSFKDEDLYNIYSKRVKKATNEIQKEVRQFFLDCFE